MKQTLGDFRRIGRFGKIINNATTCTLHMLGLFTLREKAAGTESAYISSAAPPSKFHVGVHSHKMVIVIADAP
jgi:hypothetical protein